MGKQTEISVEDVGRRGKTVIMLRGSGNDILFVAYHEGRFYHWEAHPAALGLIGHTMSNKPMIADSRDKISLSGWIEIGRDRSIQIGMEPIKIIPGDSARLFPVRRRSVVNALRSQYLFPGERK